MRILIYTSAFAVCHLALSVASGEPLKNKPFYDKPHSIPGKVEAEHYDRGAAELAYHDNDEKNHGANYRGETQVDIEKRSDASNGHGVGWTHKGEWIVYSVKVKQSGNYTIEIPVASDKKGGTFHLEFDGKDVTGPISVPDTGGWDKLQRINKENVRLRQGLFQMKMVMDSEGASGSIGDIDYLRFVKVGSDDS